MVHTWSTCATLYVCMYVCMYVCVCVYIYIYIHTYIHAAYTRTNKGTALTVSRRSKSMHEQRSRNSTLQISHTQKHTRTYTHIHTHTHKATALTVSRRSKPMHQQRSRHSTLQILIQSRLSKAFGVPLSERIVVGVLSLSRK
jgi:hypothetical protein